MEVPTVERREALGAEPLHQDDEAGAGTAQGQIAILLDEFRDSLPIGRVQDFYGDFTGLNGMEERGLGCRAELAFDQVGGLGNDQCRRYERSRL